MKLLSVHIDKYKNLSGDYDFTSQDGYIALIGENGSGKSNLLEAISLIYHGIFDKKEIPFDYTIKYQIGDSIYERGKRIAKKDGEAIKASDIYHPSSIIACYSGEDRRLWTLAYKDYYNRYFNKAIGENYYTPKLLYIDKSCWEIALIALICAYDTPTINTFLNNLGITDIGDITISFQIDEERREMFKKHDALRWFNRVTPDGTININAKTLATTDTNPTSALAQKESKSKLVFQYLYLLSQPERKEGEPNRVQKLINSIDIKLKNVSFGDLSEGEKKLILIECITKVLGDKNSLLLLDEPDAHTHIARKKDLLEAIEAFEGQTILTTHSPVFANKLKDHNIISLKRGKMESMDILSRIKELSGGLINYFDGTFLLDSNNPLILVEGIGDINYINKAIEVLKPQKSVYASISWDILCMGGAGENAKQYVDKLRPLINANRKVLVLLDRDDSGAEAMKKFGFVGGRENFKTYKDGNWHFLMLPKTDEHTDIDFTIEDYFSIGYKKQIAQKKIEESGGFFKRLPKDLRQNVKDTLGKQIDNYTEVEMKGFSILIDKILNILDGTDTNIEEVIH